MDDRWTNFQAMAEHSVNCKFLRLSYENSNTFVGFLAQANTFVRNRARSNQDLGNICGAGRILFSHRRYPELSALVDPAATSYVGLVPGQQRKFCPGYCLVPVKLGLARDEVHRNGIVRNSQTAFELEILRWAKRSDIEFLISCNFLYWGAILYSLMSLHTWYILYVVVDLQGPTHETSCVPDCTSSRVLKGT